MDRCGIFVDAGYLIAEGAKASITPAAKRGDVSIDYPALVERLCNRATPAPGSPLALSRRPSPSLGWPPATEGELQETAEAFAITWMKAATPEDIGDRKYSARLR